MRKPSDTRETQLFTYATPHAAIDEVNVRILEELRRDPRLTMTALGRRIGMSAPAVTERVRRLEEVGIIRGYRLDLDAAALGLPLTAYIRIRPDPGQLPRVAELARSPQQRTVIVPADMAGITGSIAGIGELVKSVMGSNPGPAPQPPRPSVPRAGGG